MSVDRIDSSPEAIAKLLEGVTPGPQMTADTCPTCRGTGIASRSPYIMGLPSGDLYSLTACACDAGKAMAAAWGTAQHAEDAKEAGCAS